MRPVTHSVIGLCAALLVACTGTPTVPPVNVATREAEARAAVERGDLAAARSVYADLIGRTTGEQRRRFSIELARTDIALGNADSALAILGGIAPASPGAFDTDLAAVRAEAYFALGRTVEAVQLLVDREIWLTTPAEIGDNQQRIWDGLSLPSSAASASLRTGDSIVDGWLALAPLTSLSGEDDDFRARLVAWGEEFVDHPAAGGILAERLAALRSASVRPARIALLLPLSSVRAEAQAVSEGFLAAHLESGFANDSSIHIYDTARRGDVESFLTAQIEGADFVVGPLLTDEVSHVRERAGFVPTLALNLSDAAPPAGASFYQFALSSDDEIDAIAARAIANGNETAVVLTASDRRGEDIADRFREAFESLGGRVINEVTYVPGSTNLAAPVEALLNVTQSKARFDRLRANLGQTIEFQPRRRADVDMIFLQADPPTGRVLVPLLRNNGADPIEIPTYATSEIYDPTRAGSETDLDGLIFPDLPLLIEPGTTTDRSTAGRLLQLSTESARQWPRLFAFGFDAYRLIEALSSSEDRAWRLAGTTGDLSLDADGRIRRSLPFAEFRDGSPVPLSPDIGLFGSR